MNDPWKQYIGKKQAPSFKAPEAIRIGDVIYLEGAFNDGKSNHDPVPKQNVVTRLPSTYRPGYDHHFNYTSDEGNWGKKSWTFIIRRSGEIQMDGDYWHYGRLDGISYNIN